MAEKVAYIVVCWNNKSLMKECLDAIQAQTYKHKVVYVIDNASSDGSADFIAENYPDVRLVRSGDNNGFARGNNILIKQALRDPEVGYMALVNTDAMIDPDWTEKIVAVAKQHPKAAGLQGVTIDYFNRRLVDSHHIKVSANLQSIQYGYKEPVNEPSYFTQTVMGVNAAAAIYTRAYIEAQPFEDFFDEKFFMYLEDVDVSLRAVVLGWENYFVQGARAYHMGSVSAKKRSSDYSLYMTVRNQAALLYKNVPFAVFRRCFKTFIKFEVHFMLHLRRLYGTKTFFKLLKARCVGILRLPIYIAAHRKIKQQRAISNEYLLQLIQSKS
ncbi:MAG TPA: glycosyltransferase family 2 protein [Candidatus Saccharimonadales bacterium]